MSTYQDMLALLESKRCEKCLGLGKLDDAAPGDMYVNEWACDKCGGTGLNGIAKTADGETVSQWHQPKAKE